MDHHFDIIVVGGGIVGCSIAYHLVSAAQTTPPAVCLLERSKLTSGTTWHAAGLVAQLRASANLTRLAGYSGRLYERLQQQGEPLGFKRPGGLTLAANADRRFELQKQAAMARHNGINCEWLPAAAISERWPQLHCDDLAGGVYMPEDAQTNPVDTTLALARLARADGAEIKEDTPVTRLLVDNGRACGVATATDHFYANQVVLCAGLWTRDLGAAVGANFPLYPAEHFYAVTEPQPLAEGLPIVRVPDHGVYIKPDAGRLLIGCFESRAKPIDPGSLGADFSFAELPFDLEHFAPYLQNALQRLPGAEATGIRTWFNGPESFTPDGRYLLGESAEVAQLFVAAGFNSIGIQSAGGVGRVMAEWMHNGRPPMDLWEVDVRRFQPLHNRKAFLVDRTAESLGRLYAMHWPFLQPDSARNQRQSPLHNALQANGACFGELAGWERPNWYAEPGSRPGYRYTYGLPDWFANARREHTAVRHDVALFDQSSFAKYLVRGVHACAFLNRLCTADVDISVGRVVYCQWLNEDGGIEADVTITRLHQGIYWVVSAAACVTRDLHWMSRQRGGLNVQIDDITERYAVLGVMGPNARRRLQPLTRASLADADFPFGTSRQIELAGVLLRATRITYVGELGWELYIPWDLAEQVYQALNEQPMSHAGYHAMDSLRMEKAYRHWGHDISDEDTPLEAGLSFTVDWQKEFIGKAALLAQRERLRSGQLNKRLALFQLSNSDTLLTHDEPLWLLPENGAPRRVGHVRSSAYSFQFNCSLAFAYVEDTVAADRGQLLQQQFELEVADRRVGAEISLRSLYDPGNQRIRR